MFRASKATLVLLPFAVLALAAVPVGAQRAADAPRAGVDAPDAMQVESLSQGGPLAAPSDDSHPRRKSVGVAMALNVLLPGLGSAYAENWKHVGLIALSYVVIGAADQSGCRNRRGCDASGAAILASLAVWGVSFPVAVHDVHEFNRKHGAGETSRIP